MSDTTTEPTMELEEIRKKAVQETMRLFSQFIIYEQDKPDEARIMEFPAYMHITKEDITREINARYTTIPQEPPSGSEEDQRTIKEAVDDGIKVLQNRTDGQFTNPGGGALSKTEFESLLDLAHREAQLFYRVSTQDALKREIQVCSKYTMRSSLRPGTRFRHWITVENMAKLFIDVLTDDEIKDKISAMIEYDEENNKGHVRWFLRWREANLI